MSPTTSASINSTQSGNSSSTGSNPTASNTVIVSTQSQMAVLSSTLAGAAGDPNYRSALASFMAVAQAYNSQVLQASGMLRNLQQMQINAAVSRPRPFL